MDLPLFIIVDILSRLPIRTLLQCRCVCKTWFNLLLDPYFNNVRLSRSPYINVVLPMRDGFYLLELGQDHDCNYTHQTHGPIRFKNTLELGHDSKRTHQPQRPLRPKSPLELGPRRPRCCVVTFDLPRRKLELVGSCNGLLCFTDYYRTIDNVYITNSILGEYVALPKLKYKVIQVAYGFGFGCSSATGQYKVIMIIRNTVEVCTLTSSTWRKLGDAPFQLSVNQCGVTLHGAAHWIVPRSECIYAFDIEDEQFHPIRLPPNFANGKDYVRLGVLENCLCVFDNSWHHLDIWSMKDYGVATSWTKDCILRNTIPSVVGYEPLGPITIWKNGEILMSCGGTLVSYDPKERNFTELKVDGSGSGFKAVTFVSNFRSLKDIPLPECTRILDVSSK